MVFNVADIVRNITGIQGLPFPLPPKEETGNPIAESFPELPVMPEAQRSQLGTPMWGINVLGRPVFMPAKIDGIDLPNPLVTVSGSKEIKETVLVDVGTVFERVFTNPYNISIIMTLIAADGQWPEDQFRQIIDLWKKDDVVTFECAITDLLIPYRDNLVINSIDLPDMQGVENVQIIRINARSNQQFELELKPA